MSGRIVIGGSVYVGHRQPEREANDTFTHEDPARYYRAIAPTDQARPAAGEVFSDAEEQVVYRVLPERVLRDIAWQPMQFWRERWAASAEEVRECCRRGWLEAALGEVSQARRYRCPDERAPAAWCADLQKQRAARTSARKQAEEQRRARILEQSTASFGHGRHDLQPTSRAPDAPLPSQGRAQRREDDRPQLDGFGRLRSGPGHR